MGKSSHPCPWARPAPRVAAEAKGEAVHPLQLQPLSREGMMSKTFKDTPQKRKEREPRGFPPPKRKGGMHSWARWFEEEEDTPTTLRSHPAKGVR